MSCDSREWPFAFASICDVLGLDVAAARARFLADGDHQTGRDVPQFETSQAGVDERRSAWPARRRGPSSATFNFRIRKFACP